MTNQSTRSSGSDVTFNRRSVLKGVGAAGTLSAFGNPATANEQKRFVVGTTPGRADVAQQMATQVITTLNFGEIGQAVVGRWPEQALTGLRRNPHVRYVEEDTVGQYHQQIIPWGVERIGADIAHTHGHTGNGIAVGIIDSGIDSQHPDLAANLGEGFAIIDACTDCPEEWDDVGGHGTPVAGIVGAIDNDIDVVGVAPQVTLHALKVGDLAPTTAAVAEALQIVGDEGYDVANMSLGVGDTQVMLDGIAHAVNNGVILVSSAGNAGPGNNSVGFPARHPDVIAVSNIDDADNIVNSSSRGPEVDLGAPGAGVTSTARGGGTTGFGGTSAAAPHVTGAVALLLADGTPSGAVRNRLTDTAEDIGLEDIEQGAGLLNVFAALDIQAVTAAFTIDPALPNEGELVTFDASDSEAIGTEITEYAWDFGDGDPVTTSDPIIHHTYETGGEFTVVLMVSGEAGQTDVATEQLRVNAYPVADFKVLTEPPVLNESVTFDATESLDPDGSIVSYEWDFGDGTTDTTTDPITEHTYESGGEKTVTLRVTDDDGASHEEISVHSETLTVHIRVAIAVKPNENGNNPINLRSQTIIPVAVLHTPDFNSPAQLNPASVRFGTPAAVDAGNGDNPVHPGGHVDDVNDSGLKDWHCHFQAGETGFAHGDTQAKLVGETNNGVPIFGSDTVRIVGRP